MLKSLAVTCLCTGVCLGATDRPVAAVIAPTGKVALVSGRTQLATIAPGLFEKEWRHASMGGPVLREKASRELRIGRIKTPSGANVRCELRPQLIANGLALQYRLTPETDLYLDSLNVSLELPAQVLAGGKYLVNGKQGRLPASFAKIGLWSGSTKELRLDLSEGTQLRLQFAQTTPVLLQDNRQWGTTFSVRVGPQLDSSKVWPGGKALDLVFTITTDTGLKVEFDEPVIIQAGDEWIPLQVDLDIEPGSALDFSGFGQFDAPAGKHGWMIARPDGQLAFEKDPKAARRYYGANLCFGAHYLSHEESDRLADRLMRLGYNAIRFHHYERELIDRSAGTSTKLNPQKLDQLDYLFAALKKRGIYVTTDLFVSRPVFAHEVFSGAKGDLEMNEYKMLVPVNDKAMANWKAFTRNLLTHVNPYTGMRYADDPALAWLSMINEGNFGNYTGRLSDRAREDWDAAWRAWLQRKHGNLQAKAWGKGPEFAIFLAETDRAMCARMRQFLREEIGTKALLTNMNGWSNPIQNQASRQDYDYVDDHFYVDHPRFLERRWSLPSHCNNRSPVAEGAPGGRHCAFTRLFDKPFTISEYNYSGPGRFRGVGGILTGCMGALQNWSVIWRFAYCHNRDGMLKPRPANYFDMASDPLNLAADRASVCLFLRGDMRPAAHAVAIAMTERDVLGRSPREATLPPSWHALALITRVGSFVGDGSQPVPADMVLAAGDDALTRTPPKSVLTADPYDEKTGQRVVDYMRDRNWLRAGNVTNLEAKKLQSETGELLIDAPKDVLVLNTPKTAGGYAPEGKTIDCGSVSVSVDETDATVWVSSLDGQPIAQSKHLLITHLTDLQNTDTRFGERARQTLLAWGKLPHLVRRGRATVRLNLSAGNRVQVWALTTSGKRLAKVAMRVSESGVSVPLDVKGAEGARMLYEVVTGP